MPRSSSARKAATAASVPPSPPAVHSASVVCPLRSSLISLPISNLLVVVNSLYAAHVARCVTRAPARNIGAMATPDQQDVRYEPHAIERRWQRIWADERT